MFSYGGKCSGMMIILWSATRHGRWCSFAAWMPTPSMGSAWWRPPFCSMVFGELLLFVVHSPIILVSLKSINLRLSYASKVTLSPMQLPLWGVSSGLLHPSFLQGEHNVNIHTHSSILGSVCYCPRLLNGPIVQVIATESILRQEYILPDFAEAERTQASEMFHVSCFKWSPPPTDRKGIEV